MANLHKFVSSHSLGERGQQAVFGKKAYDKAHFIGTSLVKAATPPEQPAAVPMPDEDAIQRAKKRALAAQLGRTGRASTILSDTSGTSDRLGP